MQENRNRLVAISENITTEYPFDIKKELDICITTVKRYTDGLHVLINLLKWDQLTQKILGMYE